MTFSALTDATDDIAACAVCGEDLPRRRFLLVDGVFLELLCSEVCFVVARGVQRSRRWTAGLHAAKQLTIVLAVVMLFLTPHEGPSRSPRAARASMAPAPRKVGPPPLPAGWFGPEWPPTEESVLAALGRDAWVHPLAGPVRRMPRADSRVFGADRPGSRPVECRNGHCGVDLGGEIWGEHVHAVHDGVVDFVQRGPNPERGGSFVRISHRDGTVFSQYFHLAAIPRGLERGTFVKGGDVIGLLGDTGVKESAPHLHFALSVRASKDGPERFVDPEPLIALWPLRVPVDGSEVGLVTTVASPGMPLGSASLSAAHRRKLARQKRGSPASADAESSPAADEAPAETEAPEPPAEEE